MPIEILTEHAYRGYLEPVNDHGLAPIHIARVCFSDGVTRRAYVKLYSGNTREFVNEITGHLLAAATGLRVPEHAAIVMVPINAIPDPPPWARRQRADTLPCWCTADMASPSIKMHFHLHPGVTPAQLQPVIDELRKSSETPAILALDDWIANVDRNLGNLLRLGKNTYVLIDHGRIFGGPMWSAGTLPAAGQQHHNTIRKLLGATVTAQDYRSTLSLVARDNHEAALFTVCEELLGWWCDLLGVQDIEAAAAFLR